MRVAMIGSGYVGLVSGACFADFGHHVTCVDKDADRIARLRKGEMRIFEPDLDRLVVGNTREKRLDFTTDLSRPVAEADAEFIAVGTPSRRGDGHADLSYVHAAAAEIGAALTGFTVVITKSTVPVGTGDDVERIIRETRPDADAAVVSNPEFLREGAAIQDFKHPDRIVVGTEDERARKVMAELYRPLYINEIADLCEKVGADVQQIARGVGLDNRIGSKFLHAGPGYGGSCFPKDTVALIKTGQDYEAPVRIVETVAAVNEARKRGMFRKIAAALGGSLRGKTIAVLGLTFKPNTDDMRDAPSIPLITALLDMGAMVRAYDPVGMEQARQVLAGIEFCDGPYACAKGADALAIVTEWEQFRALDFERLKGVMKQAVLVDLRNVYRPEDLQGFAYHGIGRGAVET